MGYLMRLWMLATWVVISVLMYTGASAAVISVGPGRKYTKPSAAAKVAQDGDIITIDAGVYMHDVAVWHQNNLTIRGVGGRAHLKANGASAGGKAIWVMQGNNAAIEDIEFSGARVRDKNGAGIRLEGTNLTVRRCSFHNNEIGLLTGRNPGSEIVIEHTEFAHNGLDGDDAYSYPGHNIYIGEVRSFTLRYSYVHHAKIGHNVKSRARANYILYNRIMDEQTGTSSYLVDLPNGGTAYLIGNLLQQGPQTDNATLVAYAAEGESHPSQGVYVVNNTFVNHHHSGTYMWNRSETTLVKAINNIFASVGDKVLDGPGDMVNNLVTDTAGFVNPTEFDYRLTAASPAIDQGHDLGSNHGFSLTPLWHYLHVAGREVRPVEGPIDLGAYEFVHR